MAVKGPLSGFTIIDLSQAHAGPFGTLLLGDLGAEIIKIEAPGVGDMVRDIGGPRYKGDSYYWVSLNRNKKSVTLDLSGESGRKAFLDLVRVSDVVFDNARPGVMERLGVNHESLKKINPRIITCSIVGYGSSGPYRDLPSYDIIGLGISGMLSITGEPNRPPVRPGVALSDISAGIFAATGVIAALLERERTGEGRHIEVNLIDSCIYLMSTFFSYYFLFGQIPPLQGSRHITSVPFGVYPTRNGFLTLGICWPAIARVIGEEWMIDDPRFATADLRVQNRKLLEETLEKALKKADTGYWLEIFRKEDIPAGPVNNIEEAANDPQVVHNRMIVEIAHVLGGQIKQVGCPLKMGIEGVYESAPTLGQHTDEVLRNIAGYSPQEIKIVKKEAGGNIEEIKKHVRRKVM